jgi:2-polyprenyl-3-methyl-5-hydroxy-6-metoxy-1,4-benzoquinol methylase/glycosyltransferase involved in cell wall biosynthesis
MLNSAATYDNAFFHNNVYGHALELLKRNRTLPAEGGVERIHLDIGCGYGRIAEPLTQALACSYVGVDADVASLESLRSRGHEAHEINLSVSYEELLDALRAIVNGRQVASITMLDTLEHLPNGDEVLACLNLIAREYSALLVLSVPNMTHRDIGFRLAFGAFDYTADGLLDHTHVRLFGADVLERVLKQSGFHRIDELNVRIAISDQHFPSTHPALSRGTSLNRLMRALRHSAEPNDNVNQFVWLCVPGPRVDKPAFLVDTNIQRPFLSVVTRTQGKRIQSLVEVFTCLAGQSSVDFEVLIVGHRLTYDRQVAVERVIEDCPEWLRSKTRLILVDNGNRTRPLNRGFEEARGEYISILDDDDIPMAHWVETFKTLASEHPGRLLRASVVRQDVVNVQVLGNTGIRAVGPMERLYPSEFDFLEHLRGNQTPPISVAFPRGVFHDLNIRFDEELTTTEDWDYMMRVATITDTATSPKITSTYQWWISDHSSRTDHPSHEWITNHQRIFQKMDENTVLFPKGTPIRIRAILEERDVYRREHQKICSMHETLGIANEELRSQIERERERGQELANNLSIADAEAGVQRSNHSRQLHQLHQEIQNLNRSIEAREDLSRLLAEQKTARADDLKRFELFALLRSSSWLIAMPIRVPGRILGRRGISKTAIHTMNSAELDEAVRQVYASTSWRITAPIRALKFWKTR